MGSNTEYVYGKRHVGTTDDSDGEQKTVVWYDNAIKMVAWPESGTIGVGIIPTDDDGEMLESSDDSMWIELDETQTARFIEEMQRLARKTWRPKPW